MSRKRGEKKNIGPRARARFGDLSRCGPFTSECLWNKFPAHVIAERQISRVTWEIYFCISREASADASAMMSNEIAITGKVELKKNLFLGINLIHSEISVQYEN